MSKLNKYANIYDKDGNLIRKVDEKTGKLEDYTMEELEELVDKLANDKDENGKVRNPQALNNASAILMQYYQKYGFPHMDEILKRVNKSTAEEAKEKLEEVSAELSENKYSTSSNEPDPNEIVSHVETNLEPEYVDFEEITD